MLYNTNTTLVLDLLQLTEQSQTDPQCRSFYQDPPDGVL